MKIGIINIGDELLSGKILNTNAFDLSRLLSPLGHSLPYNLVVGDDEDALVRALNLVLGTAAGASAPWPSVDFVLLTGGLGPTRDDMTRQAAAAFLGAPLGENAQAVQWLCEFLGKPAAELPWGQRLQCQLPSGTEPLRNPAGTACGFRFQSGATWVYSFPGVPQELEAMARLHLLPALPSETLLERGVWTWGWSESLQREVLERFRWPETFRFSSLPGERGVRISLSCLCPASQKAARTEELESIWQALLNAIPPEVVVDPQGEDLPGAVCKLLKAREATVAVAESCTGGGLGALITEVPGSSEVFRQGFITYSNEAKVEILGVPSEVLEKHGAVSEETVLAMARGCRERSGAEYACAITGIAGPSGGSPEKPVGTVWIAALSGSSQRVQRFNFRGDRQVVRRRSAQCALNLLRLLLLEK